MLITNTRMKTTSKAERMVFSPGLKKIMAHSSLLWSYLKRRREQRSFVCNRHSIICRFVLIFERKQIWTVLLLTLVASLGRARELPRKFICSLPLRWGHICILIRGRAESTLTYYFHQLYDQTHRRSQVSILNLCFWSRFPFQHNVHYSIVPGNNSDRFLLTTRDGISSLHFVEQQQRPGIHGLVLASKTIHREEAGHKSDYLLHLPVKIAVVN